MSHTAHPTSLVDTIVTPDKQVRQTRRSTAGAFLRWFHPDAVQPEAEVAMEHESTDHVPKKRSKGKKKLLIALAVISSVLLLVGGSVAAVGLQAYGVVKNLQTSAFETQTVATRLKDELKAQNLPAVEATLIDLQARVQSMKSEYQKLAMYKNFPVVGAYYADGEHAFLAAEAGVRAGLKTVDAIVPYADVLGFAGEGSFTGGSAEERLRLLLETLSKITPVIDDITTELQTVESELAMVQSSRYPANFQGHELQSIITQAQQVSGAAVAAVTEFRPVIEVLPSVAGSGERKKYLVIFQNDNELRPTGGFMTAYAVLFVENGKVTPEKSDDIYELDKKFTKKIPIPEVLGRYLTSEKRFNLRDMNISPDFKTSMDTFYSHYREVKGEPDNIDGIIAVDTNVLTELVRVLGPIDVPGYGTFSAENDKRCDCPQIIYVLSEIVDRPTPYIREDRKGIIAPMMQSILQKAYAAPKELWPQLAELGWKKIQGRHVQFYFFDEKFQKAAETVNVAGGMHSPTEGESYLAVVDANLGGAKSNLFVKTEGELRVGTPENNQLKHSLTLTYKNNRKGDNCNLEAGLLCLNGILRDWVRIYLPKGSTVQSVNGLDEGTMRESEDLGFHVVEGVFRLAPLSQAKLQIEYTVPYEDMTTYRLRMRKQAGTEAWKYLIDVNGHEEEHVLDKDLDIKTEF